MTERDVKQWLNRAHDIDKEIKNLECECEKAFNRATSVVNGLDSEKVQTSKINATEGKYAAYADYIAGIKKRTAELYEVKAEILRAINKVDNGTYRLLLTLRYIRFMTWERIAEEMNYSYRQTLRIHGYSLLKFKDVIECHITSVI